MAEPERHSQEIERVEGRAIVSLRLSIRAADSPPGWSILAAPLRRTSGTISSLWLGPGQWMLVSDEINAGDILGACRDALAGVLHHAVDQSAAFSVYRLSGAEARALLATGCGLDLRPGRFPPGSAARTRLGQIAAVISACDDHGLEVYVDRSHADYLQAWLQGGLELSTSLTRRGRFTAESGLYTPILPASARENDDF